MSTLFFKILHMSISASWIAAAVMVLRVCLKRAPKWTNVLLWGFVAVRLLFPVSIESPLSLLPRTAAGAVGAAGIQAGISPVIGGGAAAGSAPGWSTILAWVWIAGIAALCLYTAVSTLRRGIRFARRFGCGEIFMRRSRSARRSCLGRSGRGSISPITWTAANRRTSLHTSRRICAGAISFGSHSAFCC